jgi:hypothetical protein
MSGTGKKRHRTTNKERLGKPSMKERIAERAKDLEQQALQLPPGKERDALLRRALQMNTNEHMMDWLNSPGLQPPK